MPDHEFAIPGGGQSSDSQKMTNDDFRKLMMTPRSSGPATLGALGSGSATPTLHSLTPKDEKGIKPDSGDRGEKRKKKKSYYAKLKRQEDDKMAELAAKYRDRAKERRDGGVSDRPDDVSGSGAYRAVAPDVKGNFDAAERRRQMIQESKFLGGDMEHTHLVKGLDFALLQKVRSEIIHRENAGEDEEEEVKNEAPTENLDGENQAQNEDDKAKKNRKERRKDLKQAAPPPPKQPAKEPVKVEKDEDKVVCKTIIAKNIVRTVFKTDTPDRNELFFPGRMAYIVELEEDVAESSTVNDIPTTIIRSKADIAAGAASAASLSNSTNDIVINKLTQILSYLRAGNRNKKKKKDKYAAGVYDSNLDKLINNSIANSEKKSETAKPAAADDLPIYDDVGDYVPNLKKNRDRDRDRDHHRRDRDRESRDHHRRDRDRDRERKSRFDDPDKGGSKYFDKDDHRENIENKGFSGEDKELLKKLMKREEEKSKKEEEVKMGKALRAPDHYAECYPGMTEMDDAIDDSDEEADYSKMDLGNKKGPIGRWDFDTAEEYADYMSKKEALPKAAFQYGVKMNEGRKTRGKVGAKNDKAKLDKEWNKISALIDKRKTSGGGGGGSMPKIPKFD